MIFSEQLQREIIEELQQFSIIDNTSRIEDVHELTGGWETRTISAKVVSQSRDISLNIVCRLYGRGRVMERARRDAQIMQSARKLGIPVPQVYAVIAGNEETDSAYLIMERAPGIHAREYKEPGILRKQAELQAKIHQIKEESFAQSLQKYFRKKTSYETINSQLVKLEEDIATHKLKGFSSLIKWLKTIRNPFDEEEKAFLHNDYHPENVFVDNDSGRVSVLDWGFASIGDRRLDLAWTLLQIQNMLGENARQEYQLFYEQAIGKETQNIQFAEGLKVGQRLVTIGSWMDPNFDHPIEKIDSAAIRGEYKVHVLAVYKRLKHLSGIRIPMFEELR